MISKSSVTQGVKTLAEQAKRVPDLTAALYEALQRDPLPLVEDTEQRAEAKVRLQEDQENLAAQEPAILEQLINLYLNIVEKSANRLRFLMRDGQSVYSEAETEQYGNDVTRQGTSFLMLNQVEVYRVRISAHITPDKNSEIEKKARHLFNDLKLSKDWMEQNIEELLFSRTSPKEQADVHFANTPAMPEDSKDFFAGNTLALGQDFAKAAKLMLDFADNTINYLSVIDQGLIPNGVGDIDQWFGKRIDLRNELVLITPQARTYMAISGNYFTQAAGYAITLN